jgi:methyl-accepting chemotaxis protein
MGTIKYILQLRKKVRQLEDEASNLAIFAPSTKEADAYDRLAMELHDLDSALFNAVFIKNDSKIEKLINGIQEAATEAEQVRTQLSELTNAFKTARGVVQKANNLAGKAKETLDGVKGLLEAMNQPI